MRCMCLCIWEMKIDIPAPECACTSSCAYHSSVCFTLGMPLWEGDNGSEGLNGNRCLEGVSGSCQFRMNSYDVCDRSWHPFSPFYPHISHVTKTALACQLWWGNIELQTLAEWRVCRRRCTQWGLPIELSPLAGHRRRHVFRRRCCYHLHLHCHYSRRNRQLQQHIATVTAAITNTTNSTSRQPI